MHIRSCQQGQSSHSGPNVVRPKTPSPEGRIGLSLGGTIAYMIDPVRDLGPRRARAIAGTGARTNNVWVFLETVHKN
jgi:hypothetical protein